MYWFVAVLLVCGIQAIYGLTRENASLKRLVDSRDLRKRIARRLGQLLADGEQLQRVDGNVDHDVRLRWERTVEEFLSSEPLLGLDYVASFKSGAGIQISVPPGLDGEARMWWCHLHTRRARLNQFIEQMNVMR